MKLSDLKPPAPAPEPPAWQRELQEFWRTAGEHQRIDMQVTLKMGDRVGAERLLESWQAELEERRRKKARRRKAPAQRPFRYGAYGGWFYPGFNNDSGADSGADAGGGGDGGGESLREDRLDIQDLVPAFAQFCADQLEITQAPPVRLRRDPAWSQRNNTFGRFNPRGGYIELSVANRHPVDVLRTLAHELAHHRQNEIDAMPDDAGKTGSPWEDEANAVAGRIMRDFATAHPEYFGSELEEGWRERAGAVATAACIAGTPGCATTAKDALSTVQTIGRTAQNLPTRAGTEEELRQAVKDQLRRQRGLQEASGYIPTEKERNDPRFSMALTVDVHPGETGRQANKLGLKTDSQGRPALLMKRLENQLKSIKEGLDVPTYDPAALAKKHGVSIDKIKQQLVKGIQVELEHTTDRATAREIALDHLAEFPDYYDRLARAETNEDCWSGYRQEGMKKKGDRMVPNCVPVAEDEELTEVKMSPAEFQKFLKSPAAEGIRAGFEAELIFRDTQSDVDGGESEPNYDADERAYSIDDIINFFTSGDDPISGRSARGLQDNLQEQFLDWVNDQFNDNYFDLARFQEWADDTIWPDVDDEYREQARDNLDDDEATDEDIEKQAVTLFHDDVERDWDRSGEWYDRAREELFDEYYGDADQDDWLRELGLRYMSNVAEEYGLDWPYWTDGSGSGGTRDWQEIANGLERVTGMPVRVSSGYHGAARRPGQYIIEPDSSLDSDDSDDYGLEVVSPPLPLPEAVEQLRRIIDWANSEGDAYTNSSTGLHMGVSLPFRGGDVDPVKLILFMGDQNVLETFGRESNTYARSAYERLESKIRGMKNAGQKQIAGVMELMKRNLIELADREFKKGGLLGDKYVSVHPQDGYIEFRGPGGDYLAKSDEIDGVLENTMLRLAYAMSIAGDPAAARQEYAKKLYKMLTGYRGAEISKGPRDTKYQTKIETEGENPFMRLFADYSAGMLSGEELKAKWADTVLAAERGDVEDDDVEDVPTGTPQEYEVYDRNTGEVYTTFQARNDDEAIEQFSRHHRAPYAQRGLPVLRVKAPGRKSKEPKSRRAELAKRVTRSTRDVGEQLWRVNHHSSQRWVVARSQAEAVAKAIQQDRMFDNPETRARIATDQERQQWQQDQEAQALRQKFSASIDSAQVRGRLGAPQPAGGEFTGAWEIRDAQGREIHRFWGVGNSQYDANRYAAGWLGTNRPDLVGQEVDVVPEMR